MSPEGRSLDFIFKLAIFSSLITNLCDIPERVTTSEMPQLLENDDPLEAITGYPEIAKEMAAWPDFAIFRRFRALNNKMLLYYQSQLTYLELDLHRLERENFFQGAQPHAHMFHRNYNWVNEDKDNRYHKLVEQTRNVLEKYSEKQNRNIIPLWRY